MSRKKLKAASETSVETSIPPEAVDAASAPAAANAVADAPVAESQNPSAEAPAPEGKNWGPPYKAIFVSSANGFEMGEDRRFKQRVFKFAEKPAESVLAALKENGFKYRAEEKTWTITANAETRLVADRLAREFDGGARQAASR